VILGAVDGLNGESVERTGYGMNASCGHPQVASRGSDIGMAEKHLNGTQVGSGIQQMGRVTLT
jgi:hypothetical protein